MAEEITVACEVCGEKDLFITKENSALFTKLDIFICPRCVFSWLMMSEHVRSKKRDANTAECHENLEKDLRKLIDISRESLLKKEPLPRTSTLGIKVRDRLDSIILSEDEDD